MGIFLNPDNSAFQVALNSKIYVDKTGLLEYTNGCLSTNQAMICNSRPRRFGKSITANMLTAYYSKGCDSKELFQGKEISRQKSFYEHINKYDVIHFDVQWCMTPAKSADAVVEYIEENVLSELREAYPDILSDTIHSLAEALSRMNETTGNKFIIIIDEWDVLIRDEAANTAVQEKYINFLRGLFKGTEPTKYTALAYLTGILPIKKVKTQSALNNFDEFTMIDASELTPYIGFTEPEVIELCEKYHQTFGDVKRWYDGYLLENEHIYNPKAVVSVMMRKRFKSYWSMTGTYESILPLINRDFDGLKTAIIHMLAGNSIKVDTESFQNDMVSFASKDDVLTALIHLGYLAYDQSLETAFIPNEEVRSEFLKAVRKTKWSELLSFEKKSEELLNATLSMDEETVAQVIEEIHNDYVSAIQYNNENSLSSVLSIAYLSSMQYYCMPVRELPTGRGFADYVFLPKPEYAGRFPALVIELKWNKTAIAAIQQIKEKHYTKAVETYMGNLLLVGINYDKKSREHQCIIERFSK